MDAYSQRLKITTMNVSELVPYSQNAKLHTEEQIDQIASSIDHFKFNDPIAVWHDKEGNPVIVEGHGRLLAAKQLGIEQVPVITLDHLDDEARRAYTLVHNQLTMNTGFNWDVLRDELDAITDIDMGEFGFDIDIDGGAVSGGFAEDTGTKGALEDMFAFVPFSVINASEGKWQDRKRQWKGLGISSEVGRGDDLTYRSGLGGYVGSDTLGTGTSIFDPVLCELDYLWFTNEGDTILDPFAGGSVRGVVAGFMNRRYTGIDLRPEQVDDNRKQGLEICGDAAEWVCGDSSELDRLVGEREFDHVFTCPPYGNLEVYSNDGRDISNMGADEFKEAYSKIIALAAKHLKNDRFMTVVVGNYRNIDGGLSDLAGMTVGAALDAGLRYYNDCILVTAVGTLAIRAGSQFSKSRKCGRRHQYVLNFVKGDERAATERLEEIRVPDLSLYETEE